MNYTEEQIKEICIRVLTELNYDISDEVVERIWVEEEDVLIRGENKGNKASNWTIAINFPLFKTTDYLTISNMTGEPLYLQTKHTVSEIIKDSEGKYHWKDS